MFAASPPQGTIIILGQNVKAVKRPILDSEDNSETSTKKRKACTFSSCISMNVKENEPLRIYLIYIVKSESLM